MNEKEFLKKVVDFRNSLCDIHKKGRALAQEGRAIVGDFNCNDFDGDITDNANSIGEAFYTTCELDLVIQALDHFVDLNSDEEPENNEEEEQDDYSVGEEEDA